MRETVLITGATSGIGASLSLVFAVEGYDLVTVARDEEALEKQARDLRVLGADVLPVACDLSRARSGALPCSRRVRQSRQAHRRPGERRRIQSLGHIRRPEHRRHPRACSSVSVVSLARN